MATQTTRRVVQPYLFFDGRCDEALDFYRQALGAEVEALIRFKDSPDKSSCGSADPNKVMHASFRVGETQLMASDGDCNGKATFQGFALSISVTSEADAQRYFEALARTGQVQLPLTQTFFSPSFGMVTDQFGVMWMIILPAEMPGK